MIKNITHISDEIIEKLLNYKIENKFVDYKLKMDIFSRQSIVNLVKDIVAFANTEGGYIVFGINDNRQIIGLPKNFHIDEAMLRNKISRYIAIPIDFEYREFTRKITGKMIKLAVLYVYKSEKPVFIKRDGEYEIGKKKMRVFRKGDIIYRIGSESKILKEPDDLMAFFEHFVSDFKNKDLMEFKNIIDDIVSGIKRKSLQSYELTEKIDKLISIFKTAIDDWDTKKVRFYIATLFEKLSPYFGEKNEENTVFPSLYPILSDLFMRAYKERKHMLGIMIDTFNSILFNLWVKNYNERKIKCCIDILLRLAIDFLEKDIIVTEECLIVLSNGAGDIFIGETLGSIILLGAKVYNITKKVKHKKYINIKEEISRNINFFISENINFNFEYLINSITFAIISSGKYNVFVKEYIDKEILPAILENIDSTLDELCNELLEPTNDDNISSVLDYLEEVATNWISLSIPIFGTKITNIVIKKIKKCSSMVKNIKIRKDLLSFLDSLK